MRNKLKIGKKVTRVSKYSNGKRNMTSENYPSLAKIKTNVGESGQLNAFIKKKYLDKTVKWKKILY